MKTTFLFGLFCLTPPFALSRLLDNKENSEEDYYNVALIYEDVINENNGDIHNVVIVEEEEEEEEEHGTDSESEDHEDYAEEEEEEEHTVEIDYDYSNVGTTDEDPTDYGYDFASMIWTDGYYNCSNIEYAYWVDVRNIVFTMCDFQWISNSKMWDQYAQECKTGAEQRVLEEMDSCFFDVDECSKVGVSAAAAVAGTFCKQNGLFQQKPNDAAISIPVKCVEHAKVSCKYNAVQTVQRFNQGGVCAKGSALQYIDEIYQLCEQEVSALEEAAATLAGSG